MAPGFIDIHSHSDFCPILPKPFNPQSKLYQGVTTEITGNCGDSIIPCKGPFRQQTMEYFKDACALYTGDFTHEIESITDYAAEVKKHKCATNYGNLVGHSALRGSVMGFADRDPSEEEMVQLEELLEDEMNRGAFGMSLGLIYPPSAFSKKEELVRLSKVVKKCNGIVAVHMRSEAAGVFDAAREMIEIARESGVRLEISHLKLMGKTQWHRAEELLKIIEDAKAEGVDVHVDQYPYHATSTGLSALVPNWAHDGGFDAMIERLKEKGERVLADIAKEMDGRGGPASVVVVSTNGVHPNFDGKSIEEIAGILGVRPEETVADLLVECGASTKAIYFSLCEEDVLRILKEREIAVASDGYGFDYSMDSKPHPRSFGTFPRFLRLNREHNLMPIEDAVYKITALPAQVLGITDRGVLKEGCVADITVFDEQEVFDTSDFVDSRQKPKGIEHVIVAGGFALKNGEETGLLNGTVLLKK